MRAYIRESEITKAMHEIIIPYLECRRAIRTVTSTDGTALHTVHYEADNPRGTVIWLHGLCENTEKYREQIFYCLREHLSVLIYDHRGHGKSGRSAPLGVIHVDRFEDYLTDFEAVYAAYEKSLTRPLYLFGHSMGGAVAACALAQDSARFTRAILSAPMLDLNYRGKDRAIVSLAAACRSLTRRKKPIIKNQRHSENRPMHETNYRSPARFEIERALRLSDPLLASGSPSAPWVRAALRVRREILAKGIPEHINIPILLLSAEKENRVSNEAHALFAARAPQVTHVILPDVHHEILFAEDERVFPVLDQILDFLE